MKITELFTTLPGILIVSGVVLLILAIILFIIGNKKAKKEAKEAVLEVTSEESVPTTETPVATEPAPVEEPTVEAPKVEETVEEPVQEVAANEEVAPVIEEPQTAEPSIEIPAPVAVEEPVTIAEPTQPEVPTYDFTISQEEVPEIKIEEPATPVENNETELFTISEPTPAVEEPIYGGANPIEEIKVEEEKPVTIYGGADPLEKTQNFPTIEEKHEPYGGTPEINVVEPTVEAAPEVVAPVIDEPFKIEEPDQL